MPRTSLNLSELYYGSTVRTHKVSGVIVEQSTSAAVNQSLAVIRQTVNTPGFHSLSKSDKKLLPTNPFLYDKKDLNYLRGSLTQSYYGGTEEISYKGMIPWGPAQFLNDYLITGNAQNVVDIGASNGLLTKARDSSFDIGVFGIELPQTIRSFVDLSGRLLNSYRLGRQGRWQSAYEQLLLPTNQIAKSKAGVPQSWNHIRSVNKSLSSDVLLVQYGVRPLVNDFEGLLKELERKTLEQSRRNIKYKRTERVAVTTILPSTGYTDYVPVVCKTIERYSKSYSIWYRIGDPDVHRLANWGIRSAFPALWERTPWSFAIDWAIPVGQYLTALGATDGLVFEQGSETIFRHRQDVIQCKGTAPSSPDLTVTVNAGGKKLQVLCDRKPISSWPLPRIPMAIKTPFGSLSRGVSQVALLAQLVGRRI